MRETGEVEEGNARRRQTGAQAADAGLTRGRLSQRARRAELAQQKNVKEFLEGAGLMPEIVAELSDVLQSNHRSVGPFIEQMAENMGIKPQDFLKFLNDKDWNFKKTRTSDDVGSTKLTYNSRRDDRVSSTRTQPQSLETAKAWLKAHDLLPPGAK